MAEEDDPVEHEIQVYLSKNLADGLYVLQYPVRPCNLTYDNVDYLSAKVKPNQKRVELEVALNTRSPHYARSKGEQIALNVDGQQRASEGSHFTSDVMDKQVLISGPSSGRSDRYAVGVFKDGELHLTPVCAQVQMRPSFEYLDKVDAKQKAELGQGDGNDSQDEPEDDAKPVHVKFARPESDAAKARRLASYEYVHRKKEEEAWVAVDHHNIHDDKSESLRDLLYAHTHALDVSEFELLPKDYLKMLMPPADETSEEKPAMPNNVLSLMQLKTMPLGDQVKALLTNAKVIKFSQLMTLLPQGTDPQATLRSLQHVAVMVQGCWVVKSEILYPKDSLSPHSGVAAEHLCRGRDFVMWRYTQSRCVTRKEISSIIKLPSEDVKDVLEQMSRIKVNQGWEFVFQNDLDFIDRYSEISQRQKMLWDAKYQNLSKQLNITKEQEKKIKDLAAAEAAAEKPRRRRTSSRTRKRTLSGRSISDHSDVETDPLKSELEHADKAEPLKVNGTTMEISAEPHPSSLDTVSPELKTELVNFIQEKLYSRLVLSMSELKRLLNVKLSVSPPGHVLSKGVTDKLFEETVIEVGGMALDAKWMNESIFILVKTGNELDPLRAILADMLKKNYKVKKNLFQKKVEAESGMSPSENDLRTVLKDFCDTKNGQWFIKCCMDWS